MEDLTKFGMTKTEEKVYIEITKIGNTKIGPIIKRTGLHRGTVYNSINNLIEKGFLSFIDQDRERYYKISGKKIFKQILDKKEEEIAEKNKEIDNFFNNIDKIVEKGSRQDVQVYYGVEAFKSLFFEIYDYAKGSKEEYFFQGRGGEMQDAAGEGFYKHTQELKKKLGIKCRVILDRNTIKHAYYKHVKGNIRFLPSKVESPVSFWIYGNIILFVLFGTKPLISIKIQSKSLADSFRNYFENLWEIGEKP